jgi:predicted component of type VI protein secretion system
MARKKLLAVVCLCLLLALAGCNGTKPVQVEVDLEDVSAEGEQVRFVGNASLEGWGSFRDGA